MSVHHTLRLWCNFVLGWAFYANERHAWNSLSKFSQEMLASATTCSNIQPGLDTNRGEWGGQEANTTPPPPPPTHTHTHFYLPCIPANSLKLHHCLVQNIWPLYFWNDSSAPGLTCTFWISNHCGLWFSKIPFTIENQRISLSTWPLCQWFIMKSILLAYWENAQIDSMKYHVFTARQIVT